MKRLLTILSVAILIAGCSAGEGPAGPVGPQGERGADGERGRDGAANVTSTTFTIDAGRFSNTATPQYGVSMPGITQDVFDSGVVLSYWGTGGGRWVAMPLSLHVSGGSVTLGYAVEVGTFVVQVSSGIPSVETIFDGDMIRVVTIPPGAGKRDIDYSDYAEVARAYGL